MMKFVLTTLSLLLVFCRISLGGSMSFSTDFDGIGSGTGFTIDVPEPRSHSYGPSYSNDDNRNNNNSGSVVDTSVADQQHLRQLYEEQLSQAQKRAEEEKLRKEIERVGRENNVRELQILLARLQQFEADEPSAIQRMQYTQKVLDLEKKFNQERNEYMSTLLPYRERLASSIDQIVVPPPPHPKHYGSILFLGLWSTPQEAREKVASGAKNPFTNKPYDDIFAFGSSNPSDFFRVSLDHFLGQFNLLSPATKANLVEKLRGATADEVVCHSNGCRIAEVLISKGVLNVGKLRILGGDDALFDLSYLKNLKDERHLQEVSVYSTRGDIVPLVSMGWEIMDYMKQIGHPLQSLQHKRQDPVYQVLGLTEQPKFDPNATFQVHMMTYPAGSSMNFVEKHRYENYSRMINGWRLGHCLNADGSMNQRCIFY